VLSGQSVATVLHAIATDFVDRAINVVAMSDELDDHERGVLWGALAEPGDRADRARRFGDALRSLEAPRSLVNESYRTAFYSSDQWKDMSASPLYAYFMANRGGTVLDKWAHYFPIYDRHLTRFRGTSARVLEIGVYRGGGLDMLRHYLGADAHLVGIDIDPNVEPALIGRYPVEIGDQEDPEFLSRVATQHGPFDVVIDDGGHTMRQQIVSVETLFPSVVDGGVYLVEDCHTSYWPEFSDPSEPGATFIAWAKDRFDDLNAHHHSVAANLTTPWQTDLAAIHAYDSVIVLDKAHQPAPFSEVTGTSEYVFTDRNAVNMNVELLATREQALRIADEAAQRAVEAESRSIAAGEASEDELRILRAELVQTNQQAARLRSDLEVLREELDETSSKLLGSWGIIQDMRHSRSWRLTAPIRGAKSIFGRR
jgi:cephalosporin hydroxylase